MMVFVSWDDDIPNINGKIKMFQITNQMIKDGDGWGTFLIYPYLTISMGTMITNQWMHRAATRQCSASQNCKKPGPYVGVYHTDVPWAIF